jgi:hypothetical protein
MPILDAILNPFIPIHFIKNCVSKIHFNIIIPTSPYYKELGSLAKVFVQKLIGLFSVRTVRVMRTDQHNLQNLLTLKSCPTWVLKETVIQKLLVFERNILRRIFGPTKENQI